MCEQDSFSLDSVYSFFSKTLLCTKPHSQLIRFRLWNWEVVMKNYCSNKCCVFQLAVHRRYFSFKLAYNILICILIAHKHHFTKVFTTLFHIGYLERIQHQLKLKRSSIIWFREANSFRIFVFSTNRNIPLAMYKFRMCRKSPISISIILTVSKIFN